MKRFGLDGCESLIVGLRNLTKIAILLGVDSVVLTMSHRGRLNTLANVMNKPAIQVFSEFSVSRGVEEDEKRLSCIIGK